MEGGGDFWQVNAKGYVPTLELDNGKRLDRRPGDRAIPRRPEARRRPRAEGGHARALPAPGVAQLPDFRSAQAVLAALPAEHARGLQDRSPRRTSASASSWLDKQLAGKDYLTGKQFTVADAYLFVLHQLDQADATSICPSGPTSLAFQKRVAARPKVKEAMQAEGLLPKEQPRLMAAVLPSVFVSHGSPMHALRGGAGGRGLEGARAAASPPARDPHLLGALGNQPADAHRRRRSRRRSTTSTTFPRRSTGCATRRPARPSSRSARRRCSRTPASPPASTAAAASITAPGRRCSTCIRSTRSRWCRSRCSPTLGPRHHVAVGKFVEKLSDEGVLIIGSGHMTHNLRDWGRGTKEPQPYAREFQEWVKQKLEQKDIDSLVEYRSRSPHGVRAHPTDEHFLPLFFALGARFRQEEAGTRLRRHRLRRAGDGRLRLYLRRSSRFLHHFRWAGAKPRRRASAPRSPETGRTSSLIFSASARNAGSCIARHEGLAQGGEAIRRERRAARAKRPAHHLPGEDEAQHLALLRASSPCP
mgnify:CR=1 FL=1